MWPRSRSEAKRLIRAGAVELDGKKVFSEDALKDAKDGSVLRVGKRNFVRLVWKKEKKDD